VRGASLRGMRRFTKGEGRNTSNDSPLLVVSCQLAGLQRRELATTIDN
jgi:hypothetical protein